MRAHIPDAARVIRPPRARRRGATCPATGQNTDRQQGWSASQKSFLQHLYPYSSMDGPGSLFHKHEPLGLAGEGLDIGPCAQLTNVSEGDVAHASLHHDGELGAA